MQTNFSREDLKNAIREVLEEVGLTKGGTSVNALDPNSTLIRKPSDPRFFTTKAVEKIFREAGVGEVWFVSNLDWENAKDDESHHALIQTNVGTYDDGTLSPVFGQLFAQSDTWIKDDIVLAVGPNVKDVMLDDKGRWVRNEKKNFPAPEGVKHPTHFAFRGSEWWELTEWARRSAPDFARKPGTFGQ